MSFEEGKVEMKALDEIGEFQRGKRFVKDDMISGFSKKHPKVIGLNSKSCLVKLVVLVKPP